MKEIMLVCSCEKTTQKFLGLLKQTPRHKINIIKTGNAARKNIMYSNPHMIVVCTPLSDEFGHELAVRIAENCNSKIILVCSPDICDELHNKLNYLGICVIPDSITDHDFSNAAKFVCTETASSHVDNLKIKNRIEEIKIINKAKKFLITENGYTEHQAHKYIEKQAMNTRKTRKEIALNIINSK